MGRSSAAVPLNQNLSSATVDTLLLTLLRKLDKEKEEPWAKIPFQAEVRTLEFWRSVVAECVGTFFLVFLTCGAFVPWAGHTPPPIGIALTVGFGVVMLTHCFALISGANFNPVVTLALVVKRSMSPFRGALYFTAQVGGSIAGSALLYGVTSSGSQGNLGVTTLAAGLKDWQGFAIELCFSFIIVLTYLCTLHPEQKRTVSTSMGTGPITVGFAYLACSLVGLPSTGASFNPVRSLGPAFVMNKWDSHWVYWVGPLIGGAFGGLIHEFVFNAYREGSSRKCNGDGDSSSIHSDEECYEEGPAGPPVRGPVPGALAVRSQHYDTYKPIAIGPEGMCKSTRNLDQTEGIYSGTRSLYCRSPGPAQRNILNRSQSVYAKNPAVGGQNSRIHPAASITTTKPGGFEAISRQESIYSSGRCQPQPIRSESIYAPRSQIQKETVFYSKQQSEHIYATRPPLPSDPGVYPPRHETPNSFAPQGYQAPLPPTPVNEDQKLEEENMRNAESTKGDFDYGRNEDDYAMRRKFQPRHESVCGVVPPVRRDDSGKGFSPNNSHSDSAYGSVNTPCTPNGNQTFNYSQGDQQNQNYSQNYEQFRSSEQGFGNQGTLVVDATRESLYGYSKSNPGPKRYPLDKSQNVQPVRY